MICCEATIYEILIPAAKDWVSNGQKEEVEVTEIAEALRVKSIDEMEREHILSVLKKRKE